MLCETCKKKEATVFYEETINGAKRSYSLCADCAAALEKQGELSFGHSPFSLPSFGSFHDTLFGGLFGLSEGQPQQKKACPQCGTTMSDLRSNGKVGCPECYATFRLELNDTIRSIHGNVEHVGRTPSRFRQNRGKADRLASLKQQLKDSIAEEDFERAATLRDEIRSLEGNQ